MKKIILLVICMFSLWAKAQNVVHFPGDVMLRGALNRIGFNNDDVKQINAIDFQFSYNVFKGKPSLCCQSSP
jgi:hypothetical protein